MTLLEQLEAHASSSPEKVAVHFAQAKIRDELRYGELVGQARRFAACLQDHDVAPEDLVLFMMPHGPLLYTGFIGAMFAGAVPSILPYPSEKQHPEAFWAAHRALFARVEPKVVFCYDAIVDQVRASVSAGTIVLSRETLVLPERGAGAADEVSADRIALLQHSSGTTGLKRGVALTYGQIAAQVAAYAGFQGFTADDTVATWLPLYHDMGLISSFLMPLSIGAGIVALDPFEWVAEPMSLLEAIAQHRATHCWMPNFAFSHIRKVHELRGSTVPDLSSVRAFVSCSEPVRADSLARFQQAFASAGVTPAAMKACYAMAETVFAVSQSREGAGTAAVDRAAIEAPGSQRVAEGAPGSVDYVSNGPVLDGLEVRIAQNDRFWPVAPMQDSPTVGEIQIRGSFVFAGYYRNPEETAQALTTDGWYRTGDLGFSLGGELFITGRIKELLIVHGKNFYAGDIEALISEVEGVKSGRAVAFTVFDSRADAEECIVLAETEETDAARLRDLKRRIKAKVADSLSLTIKTVDLGPVGTLAKTTSGKMSRARNKEIWEGRRQAGAA